jgi:hypothetical protein
MASKVVSRIVETSMSVQRKCVMLMLSAQTPKEASHVNVKLGLLEMAKHVLVRRQQQHLLQELDQMEQIVKKMKKV